MNSSLTKDVENNLFDRKEKERKLTPSIFKDDKDKKRHHSD